MRTIEGKNLRCSIVMAPGDVRCSIILEFLIQFLHRSSMCPNASTSTTTSQFLPSSFDMRMKLPRRLSQLKWSQSPKLYLLQSPISQTHLSHSLCWLLQTATVIIFVSISNKNKKLFFTEWHDRSFDCVENVSTSGRCLPSLKNFYSLYNCVIFQGNLKYRLLMVR